MKAGRHPGRPRARLQPQSGVRGRARPQRCGPGRRKAGAEARKAPRPLHLPPLRQSRPRTRSGTDTDREPAAPPRTQLPSSTHPAIIPASTNHSARAPRRGLLLATTHVHHSLPLKPRSLFACPLQAPPSKPSPPRLQRPASRGEPILSAPVVASQPMGKGGLGGGAAVIGWRGGDVSRAEGGR